MVDHRTGDRHHHGLRLRCRADATAERLGPEHGRALLALSRRGPQSLQRDQHQELCCLVTRDLHPEMPESCKVKAVDCSRQQYLQQASNSINKDQYIIAWSNCSSEIKAIRIPESCFLTTDLDPKYAVKPRNQKMLSFPHESRGNFSAPVAIHG